MGPLSKINTDWSPSLAYAVGLIVTDGCLSKDGRHIDFTSKDKELAQIFRRCLRVHNKIGTKRSGRGDDKLYYRIQIGDINFYNWLNKIGIPPRKSKVIGAVDIPDGYFADFVRGHFDGDGSFYSFRDRRWRSSYMFYTSFISASINHIKWLRYKLNKILNISGHIVDGNGAWLLRYAKKESALLNKWMYYNSEVSCLARKRQKVSKWIDLN